MSKKDKIAIFFGDMTEEGQKKVVAQGLAEIGDFSGMTPDEIEVESVTVEPEAYGYDQDPENRNYWSMYTPRHPTLATSWCGTASTTSFKPSWRSKL